MLFARQRRILIAALFAALGALASVIPMQLAFAAPEQDQPVGQVATSELLPSDLYFSNGFARLADAAPEFIGQPLSAELPGDKEGSTIQKTTTGVLLYWQGPGHPAVATDGYNRVSVDDSRGMIKWVGDALDPPPPDPVLTIASSAPSGAYGAWGPIKGCETPNLGWNANTGNGFEGGLQFLNRTWLDNGGGKYAPHAYQATPAQQMTVADNLLAANKGHYYPWPRCRIILGLP